MTKNEQFLTLSKKFVNQQFSEFGLNSKNQVMTLFTEIFVTEVVKIKEWSVKNLDITHPILKKTFLKIYLGIFTFSKEKGISYFFQY